MNKKSEQVLYITLIDFLLQIIFLGLVIGVIYAVESNSEQVNNDKEYGADKEIERIKQKTGISDLTVLTDELTRLGRLQVNIKQAIDNVESYKKIEEEIKLIGGIDKAKAILKAKAQKGQGSPSCLEDENPIVTFHAYENKIEIKESTDKFEKYVLSELGLNFNEVKSLKLKEFKDKFAKIKEISKTSDGLTCKFNVKVCEYSNLIYPRDTIQEYFWIKRKCSDRERILKLPS